MVDHHTVRIQDDFYLWEIKGLGTYENGGGEYTFYALTTDALPPDPDVVGKKANYRFGSFYSIEHLKCLGRVHTCWQETLPESLSSLLRSYR